MGKLPPDGRKRGKFECYETGRFIFMTGIPVPGFEQRADIPWRGAEVFALHTRIFGEPKAAPATPPVATPVDVDDAELLRRMAASRNGARLSDLHAGRFTGNDHSAADLAYCNALAFWTGRDAVRMDRIFRASGLMRPKWDKRHHSDGRTYGAGTIDEAIGKCSQVYTPPKPKPDKPYNCKDKNDGEDAGNNVYDRTVFPAEHPPPLDRTQLAKDTCEWFDQSRGRKATPPHTPITPLPAQELGDGDPATLHVMSRNLATAHGREVIAEFAPTHQIETIRAVWRHMLDAAQEGVCDLPDTYIAVATGRCRQTVANAKKLLLDAGVIEVDQPADPRDPTAWASYKMRTLHGLTRSLPPFPTVLIHAKLGVDLFTRGHPVHEQWVQAERIDAAAPVDWLQSLGPSAAAWLWAWLDGCHTPQEVEEATGVGVDTVRRGLEKLATWGAAQRHKEGRRTVYPPTDEWERRIKAVLPAVGAATTRQRHALQYANETAEALADDPQRRAAANERVQKHQRQLQATLDVRQTVHYQRERYQVIAQVLARRQTHAEERLAALERTLERTVDPALMEKRWWRVERKRAQVEHLQRRQTAIVRWLNPSAPVPAAHVPTMHYEVAA
jgi:DNA-binding transcriptional regulator GbsR (MarR family)